MVDQLVQIKMLGMSDNYLREYRDQVQAVTIADILRVAQKYIQPDKAAIVVVGDGVQVIDQIKPFAGNIELYDTAGKTKASPGLSNSTSSEGVFGQWTLEIETPMGQSIPANLVLTQTDEGVSATIDSEMGSASLNSFEIHDNDFTAALTFDMDGQTMAGQISGGFQDDRLEGTLGLQGFPPLTFRGRRS
jgi:hypothetical protein